ncbi:hypothetical protein [Candidatus Darwinibacter acetoxidans]
MWWKRLGFVVLVAVLLCSTVCPASAQAPIRWATYVTADGIVSFDYPEGWLVQELEGGFMIHDEASYEQLWLIVLPYERDWSALEHADFFLSLLQVDYPDMQGMDWEVDETGDIALVDLLYGTGRNSALGYALVIKDNDYAQTLWFHYLANQAMFDADRALDILGGFAGSLASYPGTVPPADSGARMARIDRNVDGFLFVLEFALGSPLSLAEETMIAEELKGVLMGYSEDELLAYDDFPYIVGFIMALDDPEQLAELKIGLEESIWEWVEQSDPNDPVVAVIREALLEADRVLVPGRTPLTEVAATAYAEFYVFAEHLGKGGAADLRSISPSKVREVKGRLVEAWNEFGQGDKEQVLQLPAVWTTLRRAVSLGDDQDREYAVRVITNALPRATYGQSQDASYDPIKWLNYQTTLEIQKQTFNYYMWSMGYNQTIYGF